MSVMARADGFGFSRSYMPYTLYKKPGESLHPEGCVTRAPDKTIVLGCVLVIRIRAIMNSDDHEKSASTIGASLWTSRRYDNHAATPAKPANTAVNAVDAAVIQSLKCGKAIAFPQFRSAALSFVSRCICDFIPQFYPRAGRSLDLLISRHLIRQHDLNPPATRRREPMRPAIGGTGQHHGAVWPLAALPAPQRPQQGAKRRLRPLAGQEPEGQVHRPAAAFQAKPPVRQVTEPDIKQEGGRDRHAASLCRCMEQDKNADLDGGIIRSRAEALGLARSPLRLLPAALLAPCPRSVPRHPRISGAIDGAALWVTGEAPVYPIDIAHTAEDARTSSNCVPRPLVCASEAAVRFRAAFAEAASERRRNRLDNYAPDKHPAGTSWPAQQVCSISKLCLFAALHGSRHTLRESVAALDSAQGDPDDSSGCP